MPRPRCRLAAWISVYPQLWSSAHSPAPSARATSLRDGVNPPATVTSKRSASQGCRSNASPTDRMSTMSLPPAMMGTPDAPAEVGVALEIVVGQRRLEPPEPHRVELPGDAQRRVAVVPLLGVVHHRHPRSAVGVVHLAQHLEVAVGLAPGVELDRAEAELDAVRRRTRRTRRRRPEAVSTRTRAARSAATAEQLVERHAGTLRGDVPERDVERQLGAGQQRQREVLQPVPDGLALAAGRRRGRGARGGVASPGSRDRSGRSSTTVSRRPPRIRGRRTPGRSSACRTAGRGRTPSCSGRHPARLRALRSARSRFDHRSSPHERLP